MKKDRILEIAKRAIIMYVESTHKTRNDQICKDLEISKKELRDLGIDIERNRVYEN